ncbi:hypothetical protein K501DRAFT_205642 [Backusella circina FSU 941]|nr:hypothetical protein K501DRAFT_205642 [Backusella circina FSU 941]
MGGGFNANTTSEQDRDLMIWQFLIKSEQAAQSASANMLSNEEGSRPDNLWQALGIFQKKWDLKSPDCAFRHYFYNVVPAKDVHLYQKPADHDPRAWEEAQKANPDPTIMVPALAIGFEDVMKRIDQQERLSNAHNSKLQEIEDKLKTLQVKDQLATAKKLAEYKKRHMELTQRALKFVKLVQLLRHKGYSITPDEEVMRTRYENIQDQLQRSEQFHGKLTQMWAQLQLIKESGRKYGQIGGVEGWSAVSQEDQNSITKILEEQDKGIQHMVEVMQGDTKEIESLHERWRSYPQ